MVKCDGVEIVLENADITDTMTEITLLVIAACKQGGLEMNAPADAVMAELNRQVIEELCR